MQAITVRPATAGLTNRAKFSHERTARSVVVRAAQRGAQKSDEQKAVNKLVVSTISAFAAVSLALTGPVYAIDLPPKSVVADLAIAKDDELVGNAFQKIGVPGDGNKAADALRDQTPGVGEDAKSTGGSAKGAADDVARTAQNAAPDLSLSPDDQALGNAFEKAGVPGNGDDAANSLREKVPGVEPKEGLNKATEVADDVSRKAKNAAPDLSLGKDDKALGNAFQKAGVPGNANKAADAIRSKVPGAESNPKGKDVAGEVGRKAKSTL